MRTFLLAFLFLLSVPAFAADESTFDRVLRTGVIRCGYIVWPPFLSKDPNTDAFSGIAYDYTQALARELELKVEWTEETGWGNMQEGLNTNRYDLVCTPVYQGGQRARIALLTRPVYYDMLLMVARDNDARFDGGFAAANKPDVKITVIEGDITQAIQKARFSQAQALALPQMSDPAQMALSVASGKADVGFGNIETLRAFNASSDAKLKPVAGGLPVRRFGDVYALKKGEFAFKAMLDAAIESINASGEAEEIVSRYAPQFEAIAHGYQAAGVEK